jgi:hypothetical protein
MATPRRTRCGEPLPTGDYGPVTCSEWAKSSG